ncbi:MAG: bifunctional metallophosphatase/5'-nucleotidase [Saprospiraceae bacterium]|nr:bifunctional metallophosphatase/5'-nucleotidase [Saprospiraceae bacterium]
MQITTSTTLRLFLIGLCFTIFTTSCGPGRAVQGDSDDGRIEIAFLQMNDVYEINGVEGGKSGGLARVTHVYKTIRERHPQAMLVLAGDFLNPSLIGTLRHEGERIRGRQMIEVLNAMGLDLVAFGNHEFDISEEDLQQRINESQFDWIATNIQQICGDRRYPFYKEINGRKAFIPGHQLYHFRDADGTELKLGIISATLDSNPQDYVHYYDWDSCGREEMALVRPRADVVIGLTHLEIEQDMAFAEAIDNLPLIMGGHEHDNMIHQVGETVIAKADANAKTVYLHVLTHDKRRGQTAVSSELITIDQTVPKDPVVADVIQRWIDILDASIRQTVPDPYEVVYRATAPLDGRESTIRHRQSNMGELFAAGMLASSRHGAVAAILNSGSIRIDDQISGDITAIDIFRALPFGGAVFDVELKGSLLRGILDYGLKEKGSGAFLQYAEITRDGNAWVVGGEPLDDGKIYLVTMNDFLLRGFDIPFLTEDNGGIVAVHKPDQADQSDLRTDIRKAIISFMKAQ